MGAVLLRLIAAGRPCTPTSNAKDMKSGTRRKVDDLGRVVIPAGIRRSLGIREGDALEVSVRADEVVLSKPVDQCVFCHCDQELHTFRDKAICVSCAAAVGMLDKGEEPASGRSEGTSGDTPLSPWPDAPPTERRALAVHEGGLRVVRSEAATPVDHEERPASTTAW